MVREEIEENCLNEFEKKIEIVGEKTNSLNYLIIDYFRYFKQRIKEKIKKDQIKESTYQILRLISLLFLIHYSSDYNLIQSMKLKIKSKL